MLENGSEKCSCVRKKCERFGDCAACIEHHKTHKRYKLPYCKRKARDKRTKVEPPQDNN
jgi:hypothetical protein